MNSKNFPLPICSPGRNHHSLLYKELLILVYSILLVIITALMCLQVWLHILGHEFLENRNLFDFCSIYYNFWVYSRCLINLDGWEVGTLRLLQLLLPKLLFMYSNVGEVTNFKIFGPWGLISSLDIYILESFLRYLSKSIFYSSMWSIYLKPVVSCIEAWSPS